MAMEVEPLGLSMQVYWFLACFVIGFVVGILEEMNK